MESKCYDKDYDKCEKKDYKGCDVCHAAIDVIHSIADQESAIACILSAECAKIHKAISMCGTDIKDLKEINDSVKDTIEQLAKLECILKEKFEKAIDLIDK